jgi:uncharacterized protein
LQFICRSSIRINYEPFQSKIVYPFIQKLNHFFANDPRFEVIFRSIENHRQVYPVDIFKKRATARKNAEDAFDTLLDSNFKRTLDFRQSSQNICYASLPNHFIIRPGLLINKCSAALEAPINNVGRLDANGQLHLSDPLIKKWISGIALNDHSYMRCPWLHIRNQ